MSTTTNVTNLVINKLTKAQYEAIQNPDPTQLYFIIDDNEYAEVSDLPQPSNTAPGMDGTAAAGIAATYSRSDHIHPTDSTRAPINSPVFTGQPTTPTPIGDTITISGIQNVALDDLQRVELTDGSFVLYQIIGTLNTDISDADFLNIVFNGVNYILPRTGEAEFEAYAAVLTGWGGVYFEEDEQDGPYYLVDFGKYPLSILQRDDNGSVRVFVPEDYDEENSSITITSYTSKPDLNKIVNVGYLDSVLSEYSSVEPEDDENIMAMLSNLGLGTPLNDGNDIVVDDNDLALLVPNEIYVTTGEGGLG